MKQKIEALSNAFNIGFELGAKPYNAGHTNSTKAALKRAIEEGLAKMSSQQPNAVDAKEPCDNCEKTYKSNRMMKICANCYMKIGTTD